MATAGPHGADARPWLATDPALDVFTLGDEMGERGWFVQPQTAFRGMPASLHLTVSAATADGVDDLVAGPPATAGLDPSSLPTRMAPVNALLDAAPPRLREALLVAFLDHLTR